MSSHCTSGKRAFELMPVESTQIISYTVSMCRDMEESMTAGYYVVQLTVKHDHAGYRTGKQIRLKCRSEVTRASVVRTIRDFQYHGPWLEQQWHSLDNIEKLAVAKSVPGTPFLDKLFSGFKEKYASVAKEMLEQTVIPLGCRHADAVMMIAKIHDNRVKLRNDHALQDVEQTCDAFRAHFDRPENRDECIQRFAFCLYFYTAMREALQSVGRRGNYDKFEAAEERADNVLKFLKRVLLESADQRAALRKAIVESEIEFCQQLLLSQHTGKVVLPLSDLQATNKAAKLSGVPQWEMFFTMILLESTVFLRLQEVPAPGQHAEWSVEQIVQRKPFRNTMNTEVPACQLGDIVATARAEGCFEIIPFCKDTFAYIVGSVYSFPKYVRPGVATAGHAPQTMDIAGFFELATKCSMATPEAFDAIRQDLLRYSKSQADFTLPFLMELNRVLGRGAPGISAEHQRERDQLFVSYFEGFMSQYPRHSFLRESTCNLYSPLLASRELGDLMTSLFEAIMRRVQAEPPQLEHITWVLSEQLPLEHPLKSDQLMQHVLLDFFGSRPAAGTVPLSAEYRLAQYKRDLLRAFELLQHNWSLDFCGKGEMIVNKVASDVLTLGTTNAAYDYGGAGGERLAVICEVIKDSNFRALVHSATGPQAYGQLDGSLDAVVDGLVLQNGFRKTVLKRLLGDLAPDDECLNWNPVLPGPALPAPYVVWLQICERLGRNVSDQAPVDRRTTLNLLAESGHEQVLVASTSGQTNQLACAMFYNAVLLGPVLIASTFSAHTDRPLWTNLIKGEYFSLVSRAVEIFRQGLNQCEHPLANQHLAPLRHVEAAIAGVRNAFQAKDLSVGELMQLDKILLADATVARVLGIEQSQITLVLNGVADGLARLKEAKQVVQFLGTLNVERGRDEQEIGRLIAESERRPTGDITSSAEDFTQRYKTGEESLGDKLYGLVAHFQREKSVIFDATVDTLKESEAICRGDPCGVERAKEFMDQVDKQLFELLARTITVRKLRPILPALQNWYASPRRLSCSSLL